MRLEQRLKIEVAGVVDQHLVTRPEHEAADEIECLRAGIGQDEAVIALGVDGRHLTMEEIGVNLHVAVDLALVVQ